MPRNARPTRPLSCHNCGSPDVTVSESAQYRMGGGRKRLHADCRCARCRRQWWSRHPEAIRLSREADVRAEMAGKGEGDE